MKILKLVAENIKRITAVEIAPDGNMVQISGPNGAGKTSILDSILFALAGDKAIQGKPIREGADKALIVLTLGEGKKVELVVERKFTKSGSYLSVKTADGAAYPKPQRFLDDVVGALSFDPLAFARAKASEQYDILRNLVTLEIDPKEVDRLNEADFNERTNLNRDAKKLRTQAEAITVQDALPDLPLDEMDLIEEGQKAVKHNAEIGLMEASRKNEGALIKATRVRASDIRARIAALQTEAGNLESEADAREKALTELPPVPAPIPQEAIDAIRQKVKDAKAINFAISQKRDKAALIRDAERTEQAAGKLTAAMEARKKALDDAIAKADLPVAGLSLGSSEVIFKGVPFDQASDAQQLLVSTSIAAAMNPKLRVIRIRDGSVLDKNSLAWLAKFAEEKDMQIWIELVDTSGQIGFVIEDGHVKEQAKN